MKRNILIGYLCHFEATMIDAAAWTEGKIFLFSKKQRRTPPVSADTALIDLREFHDLKSFYTLRILFTKKIVP